MAEENIKFTLKLKGKSGELTIPCGNIERVDATIQTYGFESTVQFLIGDTDLNENKIDLLYELPIIEATLTIAPNFASDDLEPIELSGIVTSRSLLREETYGVAKELPIIMRAFSIHIKDPAQAIWAQHFPAVLYTEKSMEEVINLHKNALIPIKIDWQELKKKHPLVAIGLGYETNSASFYSFLMWYLDEARGVFAYDYKNKTYVISEKKNDAKEPIKLPSSGENIIVNFPEQIRNKVRVLNSFARDPGIKELERKECYETITRDYLMSTEMLSEFEKKIKQVEPTADFLEHELKISMKNLPMETILPGDLISFEDSAWSSNLFFKKNIYRLTTLIIDMGAVSSNFDPAGNVSSQNYDGIIRAHLERKEEAAIERPPYTVPAYPFFADGKIVSELGTKEELTFQIHKDEKTSQKSYRVEIPLWENQKIKAPFEPLSNHSLFYFPLLKGDEVQVAFHQFSAKIVGVKKYGERSQWPVETQGNRIVFAPKKEKAFTILEHSEENGQLLFTIERNSDKIIQKIQIKEDGLYLLNTEENKKNPKSVIHMDNDFAITVSTQDEDSKETQSVKIKKGEIFILCEKDSEKSTIIMTPTKVSIDCQDLEINTKSTNLKTEGELSCTADTLNFDGENGLNMTTKVTAELNGKLVNMKGTAIKLEGDQISLN